MAVDTSNDYWKNLLIAVKTNKTSIVSANADMIVWLRERQERIGELVEAWILGAEVPPTPAEIREYIATLEL